jgi:hypothetical protein
VLECLIAGLGWWLYARSPGSAQGGARWGLAVIVALSALMTVMGALATEPPPSPAVLATVSLATIAALSLLACWLDGRGLSL